VSASPNKTAWLSTLVAVLWGFLGVRRNSDYQQDVQRLNPLHIMLVGIVMTFLFVAGLMLLVTWIT
jgi:hypothetical protein